ncbi:MAG: IreB family regulatory phosphoprotein [Lachnospiraceae bacterium]|nr:IreB family regulatory phosphoprotein [Lachnospiraceae bacterium]
MGDLNHTQFFSLQGEGDVDVAEVLQLVCEAMYEKGYNPQSQITGYIMSGDPTYITSHKGARKMIMKVERDEILEELMHFYLENKMKH